MNDISVTDADLDAILRSRPVPLPTKTCSEFTAAMEAHFKSLLEKLSDGDLHRLLKKTPSRWRKSVIIDTYRHRHPDYFRGVDLDEDWDY